VVAVQETIGAVSHSYSQKAAFRSNELNLFLSFSTLAKDDNPRELSSTGEQFLAGIMHRVEALSAISLGACRTLRHKKEFGWSSRSKDNTILRVFPNALSQDLHIEYRLCDSSCNMYLTLAALLATGIHGMEQQLALESPYYEKDEKFFDTASLTECLEQDEFLMQTFGSALGKDYLSFLLQEANHDDDKM
jgi:glutamine synthetase